MRRRRGDRTAGEQAAVSKHPNTTPLAEWPQAWLTFACASILQRPEFIAMRDDERRAAGLPVSDGDMRAFIAEHRPELPGSRKR